MKISVLNPVPIPSAIACPCAGTAGSRRGSSAARPTSRFPPSRGIEEERAVVGRVSACRLYTSVNIGHLRGTCVVQTDLTIAPETEAPAYR